MAFNPGYASNHLFYVSYTDRNGNSRVTRYRSSSGSGVRASGRILLGLNQPFDNHNGGQLQFDKRGYLYFGLGDGGSEGDPKQTSQNMGTRLGKLLRSASTTPGHSWRIVGLGLRNPWRFSFDSATDNLWIGDVGQDRWEEVDFRPARNLDLLANYGWSRYEGYSVYSSAHRYANVGQKVRPVLVYSHAHGCSVTGGYVYRGSAVPAARGRYFYGDYCAGTVWSFRVGSHGRASAAVVSGQVPSVSSFGVDGNGELYATSLDGTLYEIR
jgi:glucose/arabinose dehydrogenase